MLEGAQWTGSETGRSTDADLRRCVRACHEEPMGCVRIRLSLRSPAPIRTVFMDQPPTGLSAAACAAAKSAAANRGAPGAAGWRSAAAAAAESAVAAPPLPLLPPATSSSASGGGCRPRGTAPRRLFSGGGERAVATWLPPASAGRALPRLGTAVCRAAAPTSCGGGGAIGLACVRAGPCRGICRIVPPAAARRRARRRRCRAGARHRRAPGRRAAALCRRGPAGRGGGAGGGVDRMLADHRHRRCRDVCPSLPPRSCTPACASPPLQGRQGGRHIRGGENIGFGEAGWRRRGGRWRGRWRGRRRWAVAGRPSRVGVTRQAEHTSTPRRPQTAAPACAGWPASAPPPLCGLGGNPTTPHEARVADRASLVGVGLPPRPWRHYPHRRAARQGGRRRCSPPLRRGWRECRPGRCPHPAVTAGRGRQRRGAGRQRRATAAGRPMVTASRRRGQRRGAGRQRRATAAGRPMVTASRRRG